MNYSILPGDCVQTMKTLPANSVQCVVTSPPYFGLRDYGTATWEGGDTACDHRKNPPAYSDKALAKSTIGAHSNTGHAQEGYKDVCGKCGAKRVDSQIGLEESPEAYVAKLVEVFREVRRVLRDDGTLWLNLASSYNGSGGAGGDYGPGGLKEGQPKYPGRNLSNFKPKDMIPIPWMVAMALQQDGWYLRSDIIWSKPNPMPESVTDRPTKAHEYIFLLSKSATYFYDSEAIAEVTSSANPPRRTNGATLSGSALRPKLSATLHTDDGAMSFRGWCDFGQSQIAINDTVTFDAKRFQIVKPIGLQVGIETTKRPCVVNLKHSIFDTTAAARIAIALQRFFADGAPIAATIADISAAPSGAILTDHINSNPFASTFVGAKVTTFDCTFITSELFAACITLERNETRSSLFVWDTLSSAHDGSFLPNGHNNIVPQENGKRNKRSVWVVPTRPYKSAHFAVFPPDLIEPCILAGTSAHGCCAACGSPYERIVEREMPPLRKVTTNGPVGGHGLLGGNRFDEPIKTTTTGWQPTCLCGTTDVVPCTVLDCFSGSGTTGAVALKHGRKYIGCELNQDYIALSIKRIEQSQPMLLAVTA